MGFHTADGHCLTDGRASGIYVLWTLQRVRCWDTGRGLAERIALGHIPETLSYSDPTSALCNLTQLRFGGGDCDSGEGGGSGSGGAQGGGGGGGGGQASTAAHAVVVVVSTQATGAAAWRVSARRGGDPHHAQRLEGACGGVWVRRVRLEEGIRGHWAPAWHSPALQCLQSTSPALGSSCTGRGVCSHERVRVRVRVVGGSNPIDRPKNAAVEC